VIGLEADGTGRIPEFTRPDGSTGRVGRAGVVVQTQPLPAGASLIVQVSRWDRLKDHGGLLTLFARDMKNREAHLALVGPDSSGVDDDPEGAAVYQEIVEQLDSLPDEVRARVHLVSLPMDDLDENAFMVNALQRRAAVIVQKSLAEGFGLTVSEGMWKSRPMVASGVGGIQDQVEDGISGILIDDPHDYGAFAKAIDGLLDDPDRAAAIGEAAQERVKSGLLSVQRLTLHYQLVDRLLSPAGP
jgi:trehalose synthase